MSIRRTAACLLAVVIGVAGTVFTEAPSWAATNPAPFPITRVAPEAENPFVIDISPDGRYILLNPSGGFGWEVLDTITGESTSLDSPFDSISRNGEFVYVTDVKEITRRSVATGATETFTIELDGDWFIGRVVSTDAIGDLLTLATTNPDLGLVRGFLYDVRTETVHELPNETITANSGNSGISHLSADGQHVTFFEYNTPGGNFDSAVLWDRSDGTTTVVGMPAGHDPFAGNWGFSRDLQWRSSFAANKMFLHSAGGGPPVEFPLALDEFDLFGLDVEGRVVFLADAPTIGVGDQAQMFVWQPGDVAPTRISVAPDGGLSDFSDDDFWIADNGSTVTFKSFSSNLVAGQPATADARLYQVELPDLVPDPVAVFDTLTPERFADSRNEPTFDGEFMDTGPRDAMSFWEIDIAGRGDVPSDAVAAILNVTLLNGAGSGFATVYPCGDVPTASSVNYGVGSVDPNEVIAKLSDDGKVCVYTFTAADVIVDVVGFIAADSPYVPLEPARFADSRAEATLDDQFRDTGQRSGGTTWTIDVAGRGDVPGDAAAAVVNLTVTGGVGPGFATVYPCDDQPNASSLNYDVGVTVPNELVAKLSADGSICVFTLTDVDVIVDVVGYLGAGSPYVPLSPARFADSRAEPTVDDLFRDTGQRGADDEWEIDIVGRGDVPPTASFVIANLTVTGGAAPGFATVFACGARPTASSLNFNIGVTRPNELVVQLSERGSLCVYTSAEIDVIVDIVGYG